MASEVNVFVVFDFEALPAPIDIHAAALHVKGAKPRWGIGAVGGQSFRIGRYDQLPVVVTLCRQSSVLAESRWMATRMDSPAPDLRARVALGTARFELQWNLRDDADVVPETASLLVDCAQLLARLTHGVTLIEGTRAVPNEAQLDDGQAFSALFPG